MRHALLPILVILVSLIFAVAGNSLLGTLLSVRMAIEGFDRGLIGPILAVHSLGFVLGTFYCPGIVRRVGHIRSFSAFAALACVSALLHPLFVSSLAWALLRGLTGYCVAGLMMVMESWINDRTSNDMRGTIMAFYMGSSYLAQGSGQFLLGIGSPGTTLLFMVAAALVALSLVPLALTRSRAPELEYHEPMGWRRLLGIAPLGMLGAFTGGVAMSGFMAVAPVFAHEHGYGVQEISVFMGVAVLFGMAMQAPVGFISDRLDRRIVVVVLAAVALGLVVPLARYAADSFQALVLLSGLFIGLVGSIYPLCVALTNDLLDSKQIVNASATLLLAMGAGTVVGPIGGSVALALVDGPGLFFFLGGALGVLVLYGAFRALTTRRLKASQQSHYVPAGPVPSTPVILEIDPRNLDFHAHVLTPSEERRRARDRREGPIRGGRRREDAWDLNE